MFTMTSPAFRHGEAIPKRHACEGQDLSPELRWSQAPSKTESFSLIMEDPDAPTGLWVHWILYNIPGGLTGLPEGVPKTDTVLDGANHGLSWGVESFGRVGYSGPCPPPGKPHRYFFKLYALDAVLSLRPRATKAALLEATRGHGLAQAELMGTYAR